MESLSKELSGIEVKMNRLLSQKAALKNRLKKKENSQRRTRTRTLIQLGGLLNLTPLLSICGIELGDDLQLEHPDKAAMLLGLLNHLSDKMPEQLSDEDLEKFKEIGINLMKQ